MDKCQFDDGPGNLITTLLWMESMKGEAAEDRKVSEGIDINMII